MGKIGLSGIQVYGHIGVSEEERLIGRHFIIDIEVEYPLMKSGASDTLEDTLNYCSLLIIVHTQMKRQFHLLEAAAHAMNAECLELHPELSRMKIRIQKLRPFLPGEVESSWVEWVFPGE
jgi:dihydroneopterin aldolase